MNCQDAQNHLTEQPEAPSDTVRRHLADCPACRRFAALQARLLALPPATPPPELDQAVLAAAEFRLARHRLRQRQRWLVAVAASLFFATWLAALTMFRVDSPQLAQAPDGATPESVWADGELELALLTIAEGARLLEQTESNQRPLPSFQELDNLLLDFELKLNFERAILGSIEERLES